MDPDESVTGGMRDGSQYDADFDGGLGEAGVRGSLMVELFFMHIVDIRGALHRSRQRRPPIIQ